jgi:hypothetical protein
MRYKIAFYDFGSTAIMHRHLIGMAQNEGAPLSFCAIQPNPYYRTLMREVLDEVDILDVFRALPRKQVKGDLSILTSYQGGFIEDLAALKRTWRRRRPGSWWIDHGVAIYQLYKEFLVRREATHLFMPIIETPEQKIAVAVARELGLGLIVPVDMRNVSGGYFACDCVETPPLYAEASAETRTQAAQFVRDFRKAPLPARRPPDGIEDDDRDKEFVERYLPSQWKRILRFGAAALERPDLFEPVFIRLALMRNFAWLRETVRGPRARRNAELYDVQDLAELPKRFVYYPLHFTPEASINTPAPFYVDQLRAIDALRLAMPNECVLIVKEHPACLPLRSTSFLRQLRRLPGVVVAKVTIPSLELVKRAALTATVTGTTALEAFLLGRPAVLLGPAIPSWLIGPHPPVKDVRAAMAAAIDKPPSDDFIIERLAEFLSVRYPFAYGSAHEPGEPVLRRGNMRRMWEALKDHLERERRAKERIGASPPVALVASR